MRAAFDACLPFVALASLVGNFLLLVRIRRGVQPVLSGDKPDACPRCGHDWTWHPHCSAESGLCNCPAAPPSPDRSATNRTLDRFVLVMRRFGSMLEGVP